MRKMPSISQTNINRIPTITSHFNQMSYGCHETTQWLTGNPKIHSILASFIEALRSHRRNPIEDLTALLLAKKPVLNFLSSWIVTLNIYN